FLVAPRLFQFVHQTQQHVEFPHDPETVCDLAQPTAELLGGLGIELQNGEHLTEAPRSHAGTVERAYVAFLNSVQHPCKSFEARAKEVVRLDGTGHDSRIAGKAIIVELTL